VVDSLENKSVVNSLDKKDLDALDTEGDQQVVRERDCYSSLLWNFVTLYFAICLFGVLYLLYSFIHGIFTVK